jgi:hypothetical protein
MRTNAFDRYRIGSGFRVLAEERYRIVRFRVSQPGSAEMVSALSSNVLTWQSTSTMQPSAVEGNEGDPLDISLRRIT